MLSIELNDMGKKDRQHYVSQSYLRNFSPDLMEYQRTKDKLEDKQKKKFKSRMKIHYYDISKNFFDCGKINSIAKMDHYLLPEVDEILRRTENKLSLLKEIIENRCEDHLYQSHHQQTLSEIANCFVVRSISFRIMAELSNSLLTWDIIDSDGEEKGIITYTKEAAELIQTMLLTENPEIFHRLLPKSFKLAIPSDNVDGTFDQISKEKGIEKAPPELQSETRLPLRTHIPNTVYPILIENNTELPFITGDMCVPKMEYRLPDLKTKIPFYHFPISPDLAITFLEDKELEKHFPRRIEDTFEIYKLNRTIYECSTSFLFSNKPEPLRLITKVPKEDRTLSDIMRETRSHHS
jgi:hypothetical protein